MKEENQKLLLKNKTAYKWLAKSDELGSYDFYNTIISLDAIYSQDIEAIRQDLVHIKKVKKKQEKLRTNTYQKLKKVYPLAHHEYTHFIDCTSSLWGMRYLYEMKEAYLQNTEKHSSNELYFYKSKNFYDKIKSLKLPDYYTHKLDNQNIRPWKYKETCGNRFSSTGLVSEYPIFFVNFSNANDELLVRSPLSMISLLESSAMSQEVILNLDYIASLPNDYKAVEAKLYDTELLNFMYNHDLTEYSVCCHVVANDQKYSGVRNSFKACALINRLILNFPISLFEKIVDKVDLGKELKIYHEEYVNRIIKGLKCHDCGTLFFVLSKLLPKYSLESVTAINQGIDSALDKLGLSKDEVKAESKKEIDEIYANITKLPTDFVTTIAESGYRNYQLIDWGTVRIPFDKLELPPAQLGDLTETVLLSTNVQNDLSSIQLDDLFDELNDGQKWVEKLNEACI